MATPLLALVFNHCYLCFNITKMLTRFRTLIFRGLFLNFPIPLET